MSVPLTAGSLVAQAEPEPELVGIGLLLGIVIGAGMAYHAHNNSANALIWGLVGFFLGIFGILVYVGYLFVRSPPDEDAPEPVAESAGPGGRPDSTQVGSQHKAAETREPDGSWPPGTESPTDEGETDNNQWRQVASELRPGGPSPTEAEQQTRTGQAVDHPDVPGESSDDHGGHDGTAIDPGESSTESRTTTQQERAAQPVGTGQSQSASTPGMAVELTYGNGDSDLLSGITRIERDDRALVVTREDGTEKRYENARIERIWDENDA